MPRVNVKTGKKKGVVAYLWKFAGKFSVIEVEHILVAWVILSLAFTFVLYGFAVNNVIFLLVFSASLIVLGCGFIMHELMHKFTAQKFRYKAEFRIWPLGIMLALITSLFGFIFAAPGATYFEPDPREQYMDPKGFTKRYGIISFAGPKINLIFGFIFISLFFLTRLVFPQVTSLGIAFALLVTGLGAFINFYLAAFNLLPLGSGWLALDGYKVLHWNKMYWVSSFAIAAAMSIVSYIYVIPYIVI